MPLKLDFGKRLLLRPSLSGRAMTDVGAGRIADALMQNLKLRELWYYRVLFVHFLSFRLYSSQIGDNGASQIAIGLKMNFVLEKLQ